MSETTEATGAARYPGERGGEDAPAVARRYGVFYPTHHVVAALPDEAHARGRPRPWRAPAGRRGTSTTTQRSRSWRSAAGSWSAGR